jgi:prepilin-type N-terminal cleavage/methylation domain-containing protein
VERICRMMKRDSRGFALVELMVVLVIIGILVAIAVPIFKSTQANAAKKANAADIRVLNGAVQMWRASNTNATEPTSVDDWKTALEGTGNYIDTWPTLQKVGDTASTIDWDTTNKKFVCNPSGNASTD